MFAGQTFVLNQQLLSIKGDMWIEDAQGNHAFQVEGTLVTLHDTHMLRDAQGNALYEIGQSLAHLHRTFEIKQGGQIVAMIQQALLTLLGDRFTITMADGEQLVVAGDWIDREFRVTRAGQDVILASRKLLSVHGGYGIQIAPGFDTALGLAIVVALEQMELEDQRR
jgi:uncharacterized protein YxjI